MGQIVDNIPNAAVLVNSMRSIGYDFESAVADIIDNSISADASNIKIFFPVDNAGDLYLEFIDDGYGMSENELIEAMRFGTVKQELRGRNDLGRFGLGLKTASISQCKRLMVISKKDGKINGFSWDMDVLQAQSGWNMIRLDNNEILESVPHFGEYLSTKSFTIVVWQKLDRILNDVTLLDNKYDVFSKHMSRTEKHIALIYHRFLESGLHILMNNNPVKPLDPFLMKHSKTTIKPEQVINVKSSNNTDEKVGMQVYVLPYHKDLSLDDYDRVGGAEKLNDQGFYIYRNKRLMIYGTWFRVRPKAELSRNARIRIDIPNTLDDLWSIDVKKQKAKIPAVLIEQLRGEVSDAVAKSKQLHDYKGNIQTKTGSLWNRRVNEREKNSVIYEINQESELIHNLMNSLDDRSLRDFKKILTMVELALPYKDIYNSVADKKDINTVGNDHRETLLTQALTLFEDFKKRKNMGNRQLVDYICSYEPFLSANIKDTLWERING
ncbi:MAG: ATP-binding protein [Vallitaleaceae bacterium]|nr:ATP-binding protein [Vallitaleaceae bacterium]